MRGGGATDMERDTEEDEGPEGNATVREGPGGDDIDTEEETVGIP